MADVMEKTFDASAVTTAFFALAPMTFISLMFSVEIFDQTIKIISGVNSQLTENELLSASLFFINILEIAVYAARTFITLGNNPIV